MKYRVVALRRAEIDVRQITQWIAERSMQGAFSWLQAYEELLTRLAEQADAFGPALEEPDCNVPLKQALFRTPHGRTYRVV
jgi:hypothetical protein